MIYKRSRGPHDTTWRPRVGDPRARYSLKCLTWFAARLLTAGYGKLSHPRAPPVFMQEEDKLAADFWIFN